LSATYRPSTARTPGRWAFDLAAACGGDLLLVSVVAAVWIENIGEQTGPAVVDGGERERRVGAQERSHRARRRA
jgi:hypothetical protein